jgi:alpha/beta superfamily hydrolase
MDHSVVRALAERAAAAGLLALRFDFGGVRESEGRRDDVLLHLDDARSAARRLRERVEGGPLIAAGFSYGARAWLRLVNPATERRPDVDALLLLAPATRVPRTPRDFGHLLLGRPLQDGGPDAEVLADLRALPLPARVLVGELDSVSPAEELRSGLGERRAAVEVLPGLNHFFAPGAGAGPTDVPRLSAAIDAALRDVLIDATARGERRVPRPPTGR